MKKFLVLLLLICFCFASDFIPFDKIEHLAYQLVNQQFDMKLFDAMGRLVETIYSDFMNIGNNKIHWQPQDIPAGVYFVHTQVGNSRDIHKLVLVK